ncbi:MAG: pantoate--beta-alanine ligase [Elusimicrobia bacterium]|nr:pantoate--beta-alanine ligase [Elusimicrobiota bacterium]
MKIIKSAEKWKSLEAGGFLKNRTIGFVPTMGALHEGHLSLVRRSKKENAVTVVSIFVNPAQFNDKNDLKNYPRPLQEDIKMLEAEKTDFLFLPDSGRMYADGYAYRVTEQDISKTLCGAYRPGHFDGVLTAVMKLLNIIGADRAYFGEKDYQQYLLIKGMAEAFFMNTKIIPCPIVREADGLAMSSRNRLLEPGERKRAPLFPALLARRLPPERIKKELSAGGLRPEYVKERWGRRFGAVKLGKVRLIDNVPAPPFKKSLSADAVWRRRLGGI